MLEPCGAAPSGVLPGARAVPGPWQSDGVSGRASGRRCVQGSQGQRGHHQGQARPRHHLRSHIGQFRQAHLLHQGRSAFFVLPRRAHKGAARLRQAPAQSARGRDTQRGKSDRPQGRVVLQPRAQHSAVPPVTGGGTMGCDVGENNLAATSTGKVFGGGKLRHDRDKYLAHRRRLQANGSRAAKRKLRALSGREQRHVKHVNHEVSKAVVAEAIRSGAGEIRMEDLTHIRANIKAGKRVRGRLHRWAFRQLQDFVAYKAQGLGLVVTYINPAYTSQTCSVCGEIGKRVKHRFSCSCGTQRHSDVNAAVNIAGFAAPIGTARGAVTRPKFAHRVRPVAVESPSL